MAKGLRSFQWTASPEAKAGGVGRHIPVSFTPLAPLNSLSLGGVAPSSFLASNTICAHAAPVSTASFRPSLSVTCLAKRSLTEALAKGAMAEKTVLPALAMAACMCGSSEASFLAASSDTVLLSVR